MKTKEIIYWILLIGGFIAAAFGIYTILKLFGVF
jgi:hypothetical protein